MAALGRGLSSLIPEETENLVAGKEPTKLFIESILPNPYQPRKIFKEEELAELAQSIREHGIIQPIIVRKRNGHIELVAGERRCRAARLAGLDSIPAIIVDIDDKKALELAIIENVQRQDLSVVEESESYQRLMDEFHYTQEELSKIIGKSRSQIANLLRLNHLPPVIKTYLNSNLITFGHAKAILNVANPVKIADLIIKNGLNVRQTEELVKNSEVVKVRTSSNKEPEKLEVVKKAEKVFERALGLKTTIKPNRDGSGEIKIAFNNHNDLQKLILKLGVEVKANEA
ncbi:MAG: ParB/RepB/Spo0J family partition protein [Alphaproteobacteria bacterium]|jgi:ParB family chromosome partitioning protein